jgi:hypothetical protein
MPRSRIAFAAVLLGLAAATSALGQDDGTQIRVKEGQPAPEVNLPATQVGKVLPDKKDARSLDLKDLRGKNVVLYFFPKAMTKG